MIPPEKQAAVAQALQQTFGTGEYDSLTQIHVGLSTALTYKMVVKSKPYILRVTTRTDAISDPTHYYQCMLPAAKAEIAPRVLYAGIEDRISITDFIDAQPFTMDEARAMMPLLLKQLHALPPFPFRTNYLDAAKMFVQRLRTSGQLPAGNEYLFTQFDRIIAAYPADKSDWVSCHTDLKKDNILFDGNKVWLIDWEAAFLNDRYTDLAAIGNFIFSTGEDETAFLTAYFGEEPTPYQRARLFLMQQIIHLFCFALCALQASGGAAIDIYVPAPGFADFHNGLWEENINLGDNKYKMQYALVHLRRYIDNLQLPRFEEALIQVCSL